MGRKQEERGEMGEETVLKRDRNYLPFDVSL
jgi:hypothetical protein